MQHKLRCVSQSAEVGEHEKRTEQAPTYLIVSLDAFFVSASVDTSSTQMPAHIQTKLRAIYFCLIGK
jgi:hypothetical protein